MGGKWEENGRKMGRNTHFSQFFGRSKISPTDPFAKLNPPHSPTEKWELLPLTDTRRHGGECTCFGVEENGGSIVPYPPQIVPFSPAPPQPPFTSSAPDPSPCVTFRRVVAPLQGPGQSPVLPFACCVGSLRSVSRCGRCSCGCRFRVRGAQWLVCWGCAGCGGMCRLRVSGAQ